MDLHIGVGAVSVMRFAELCYAENLHAKTPPQFRTLIIETVGHDYEVSVSRLLGLFFTSKRWSRYCA